MKKKFLLQSTLVSCIYISVLILFIFTLHSRVALANTFHVATNGADTGNSGSADSPFKTIQHAADIAGEGDTIMIHAGTYPETVKVSNSGSASQPIIFEPYNGASVTVTGTNVLGNWTNTSGSIYTTSTSVDLGTDNNQVFVDGKMVNEARWPNTSTDLLHPTLATVDSVTSGGNGVYTIHDAALTQPTDFWVGASIHIAGGQEWLFRTVPVTASGPGFVTFGGLTDSIIGKAEQPIAGNHYYLTHKPGALDTAGEWSLSGGTLSIWMPGSDNPANHRVEIKARQNAFTISGANVRIEGLNIFGSTIVSTGSGDIIDKINAEYISQFASPINPWGTDLKSGIAVTGAGSIVSNSSIAYSAGDGVYIAGSGSRVTNNVIHDINYSGSESSGVSAGSSGVLIDHNTIYNLGRSGILTRPGGYMRVLNNIIHDFGTITTDLGAIYTVKVDGGKSEYAYNIMYNGRIAGFGSAGVYLDDNSHNYVVHNNVTWNMSIGMKLNSNSQDEIVYNNTFDASSVSLSVSYGGASKWDWSGSIIENNIFPKTAGYGGGTIQDHNITNAQPFVSQNGTNYGLGDGSPAIGAGVGTPLSSRGFSDFGNDLGALQSGKTLSVGASGVTTPVIPVTTPDPGNPLGGYPTPPPFIVPVYPTVAPYNNFPILGGIPTGATPAPNQNPSSNPNPTPVQYVPPGLDPGALATPTPGIVVTPIPVAATNPFPTSPNKVGGLLPCTAGYDTKDPNSCGLPQFIALIRNVINGMFIISTLLATIAFIVIGIVLLTAQGNVNKINTAKKMAISILIGFVIILAAWLIVFTITHALLDPAFNTFLK